MVPSMLLFKNNLKNTCTDFSEVWGERVKHQFTREKYQFERETLTDHLPHMPQLGLNLQPKHAS